MLQSLDSEELEIIKRIAKNLNFEPLQEGDLVVEYFFFHSIYNRLMLPNLPAVGFSKLASEGSQTYNLAPWNTPPDMKELLKAVRLEVKSEVNSFCAFLEPEAEASLKPEQLVSKYISRFEQTQDPSELHIVVILKAWRGEFQGAEEYMERLWALAPNSVDTWVASGTLSVARGDLRQAEEAYRHALELDPTSNIAAFLLSECLSQQGNDAEAARWLVRSRDLGYIM